jgi:hypothetical protein
MAERFFIDCDDDGHWFLIPLSLKDAWEQWFEMYSGGEEPPEGVVYLNGPPGMVTFEDPEVSR